MARLRGILAGLTISSALAALPARAQPSGSASLTHVLSVTVPARVKVRVASLTVTPPAAANQISAAKNADGLSVTVRATQAWVLAIGSELGTASQKSDLQWSADGRSRFSSLTTKHATIASGIGSGETSAANMFFRRMSTEAAPVPADYRQGESVVFTVSAP